MIKKGFTVLTAILLVLAISVFAAFIVISINPHYKIASAHNSQRGRDIERLARAITNYALNNRGVLPADIDNKPKIIGSKRDQVDICNYIVPQYIETIPFDPTGFKTEYTDCDNYNSGYEISVDKKTRRIIITATHAELEESISILY